jgi:hypothetical protein
MSPEDLKEWSRRTPFEPFHMTVTTGEVFHVPRREAIWSVEHDARLAFSIVQTPIVPLISPWSTL